MNSTTVWEHWEYMNGPGMNSHNHPALASVGSWFFRWIGGVRLADETEPSMYGQGYRAFLVAPDVTTDPRLPAANVSLSTMYGHIRVAWATATQSSSFSIRISVPMGTEAQLQLPQWLSASRALVVEGFSAAVWERGAFVGGTAGVIDGRLGGNGKLWFTLLPGDYSFHSRNA